ncbi:MAG: nucleoside-diphosphate sugar epimerase/dehydratase [Alphaproteobacteria bacterium]|nr:nucleoside-diphosphate sugar epimerase/dehydratase [Alphaproteobacteria bacterium]
MSGNKMTPWFHQIIKPSTLALLHDTAMAGLAWMFAVSARNWLGSPGGLAVEASLGITLLFVGIAACVFAMTGMYRGIWRYASLDDVVAILRGVTIAVLLFTLIMFVFSRGAELSRASLIMVWGFLIFLLIVPRLLYRLWRDGHRNNIFLFSRSYPRQAVPVLLVGSGDAADMFIRLMGRQGAYYPVGIIEEQNRRVGLNLRRVPVLGVIGDLPQLIAQNRFAVPPQRVLVTTEIAAQNLEALLDISEQLALPVSRLPPLTDFRGGDGLKLAKNQPIAMRPIDLEDLLDRPQNPLDQSGVEGLIQGQTVLVTGAGGSIGAELVRQLAGMKPQFLCLLDCSEFALYQIDLTLNEEFPGQARELIIGDVCDPILLAQIFAAHRPSWVFHAAAIKHVPMAEFNPCQTIMTNVIGTKTLADACQKWGAQALVMISTDKAVNPSNVMGATKRLAEAWCQSAPRLNPSAVTKLMTVRFGNVLGSNGSVVPLFQRQLQRGGPLTVTHPDMTRYFMTVREAVALVLHATWLGVTETDAAGKIFVLDMGKPVRILDLARKMVRLYRQDHAQPIEIVMTGLRPGEKLTEELFHAGEILIPTAAAGIKLAAPRVQDAVHLSQGIEKLAELAAQYDKDGSLAELSRLVPEYQPQ